MIVLYDDNGKAVQLPDEEAEKALREGRLGLPAGMRVPVLAPDGEAGSVSSEKIFDALGRGFRLEGNEAAAERRNRAQYEGPAGAVGAAAAGAARGLTFGLSDLELRALGIKPEVLRGAREANPGISTAAEIAGAVLPVVASGGTAGPEAAGGVAARGGVRGAMGMFPAVQAERLGAAAARVTEAALPEGAALARAIVPRAVGGAVEGGLVTVGGQLTEDVLNEQPSSAEKFVSAAGLGALFGGSASGLLSLAGVVGNRSMARLGGIDGIIPTGGAKPGTLEAARDAIELKAEADPTTFMGKVVDALIGKDRRAAVSRFAKDRGLRDLAKMSEDDANRVFIEGAAGITQLSDEVGSAFGGLMRNLKRAEINAGLASVDAVPVRQRGFELAAALRAEADRMAANPADFANAPQIRDLRRQARKLEKVLGTRRVNGVLTLSRKKNPTAKEMFEAFDQVRHNLDNIAHLGDAAPKTQKPATDVAKGLRKNIRGFLEDSGMFGTAASAQAHYNSLAKEFIDAGDVFFETGMFGKRAGYSGGRPDFTINPGSIETFFKSLGEPGNELRKKSFLDFLSVSKKVADEFAEDVNLQARLAGTFKQTADLAKLARAMSDLRKVKSKVAGVEGAISSAVGRSVFGAALGGAVGGPIGAVLGTAAPIVGASVIHVLDQALAQRGAAMRSMAKVIAKGKVVRDRSPVVATRILNDNRFSDRHYPRPAKDKAEAYQRTAAELQALKADKTRRQELTAARLAPVVDAAPRLGAQAFLTAERAFEYLISKLPMPPALSTFAPPTMRAVPPDLEIEQFASVVRALSNPATVLEDLATGRLTIQARDAVMHVYPDLYAEMRTEVAQAMAEDPTDIHYEQRIQLALFFGLEGLETSLDPAAIRGAQAVYAPAEPGPGGPGPGRAGKATKALKSLSNAASAMDALEAKAQGAGARGDIAS